MSVPGFHSDRGTQYTSHQLWQACQALGISQSMGATGVCFDNAMAESFFATLKTEFYHRRPWPTRAEARTELARWIEVIYNRRRLHSSLGYRTPVEFEHHKTIEHSNTEQAAQARRVHKLRRSPAAGPACLHRLRSTDMIADVKPKATKEVAVATSLLIYSCAGFAAPLSAMANSSSNGDESAYFLFSQPPTREDLSAFVQRASTTEPVVIRFQNGEWNGEAVLQSPDAKERLEMLSSTLDSSTLAGGSAVSMQAAIDSEAVRDRVALLDSPKNLAKEALEPAAHIGNRSTVSRPLRATDDSPLARPPFMPFSGTLSTVRQGNEEVTTHEFRGLGPYPYKEINSGCFDLVGAKPFKRCIVPDYAYEHDYKISTPGYVSDDANYSWSSTLPGPYKDTRASDHDDELDFTIGSSYTWLFNRQKTYRTVTRVQGKSGTQSAQAMLIGQVLRNDAFCYAGLSGNGMTPAATEGLNPWCFNTASSIAGGGTSVYYISTDSFTVRSSGTCYVYKISGGGGPCASAAKVAANSASVKLVGAESNLWGKVTTPWDSPSGQLVWSEVFSPSGGWVRSQARRTGADGSYTIPLNDGVNSAGVRTWRVGIQPRFGHSAYSDPLTFRRFNRPTAKSAGEALAGSIANVWGTVDTDDSTQVWTEVRLPNGNWSRSQTRTTKADGTYVIPLTYGSSSAGTYQWRVGARSYGQVVYSTPFSFRRLPLVTASAAPSVKAGGSPNVWGIVRKGYKALWTEIYSGGKWHRCWGPSNGNLKGGSYVIPLIRGGFDPGTYSFRVVARLADGSVAYSNRFAVRLSD